VSRLRKTEDSIVLGFLQAEIGREAAQASRTSEAESAFTTALALDRRVFPAHLGLADLRAAADPRRAAEILEGAMQAAPERAYLAFDRLERVLAACGELSRFIAVCERIIRQDQRDWRARLVLARHLRQEGRPDEAYGLLLRALEANPQVILVHLEIWRTLRAQGVQGEAVERYTLTAEESVFYRDPHVCTACRYRADDMLWRCPHCHEWNTFVEERIGPRTLGT
jgi:lipopolysaccharide biosynthesis regulator YciM